MIAYCPRPELPGPSEQLVSATVQAAVRITWLKVKPSAVLSRGAARLVHQAIAALARRRWNVWHQR